MIRLLDFQIPIKYRIANHILAVFASISIPCCTLHILEK